MYINISYLGQGQKMWPGPRYCIMFCTSCIILYAAYYLTWQTFQTCDWSVLRKLNFFVVKNLTKPVV